jgi:hypothetical protein
MRRNGPFQIPRNRRDLADLRAAAQVAAAALLLPQLAACPNDVVGVAPNTPPQITIQSPSPGPQGEPVEVEEGAGVDFVATASDDQDGPEDLAVTWVAERTDTTSAPVDLGTVTPDASGRVDKLVSGLSAGEWTVTATVHDSKDATDSASVPLLVQGENQAPGVAITQPFPDDTFIEGDVVTFVGTVNDDRGLDGIEIEWFSNVDGLLDVSAPSNTGLMTFSRSNLSVGIHTVILTAFDAEGLAGTDSVEFTVLLHNLPPTDPVVEIFPDDPLTGDELTCLIVLGSADPDGLPITYTYTWYKNGVPTLLGDPEVPASATEHGDVWTCAVVASDGVLESNTATDSVVIENSPPSADSVTLLPDPAFETSLLLCEGGGWQDDDGDPAGWQADWTVNGAPVPAVTAPALDGTYFNKGDTVSCLLYPFDGYDLGEPLQSATITIQNSPPSAPGVVVTPSPTVEIDEDMVCDVDVQAVDADGDSIVDPDSYEVVWAIDGVPDSTWNGSWTIYGGIAQLGQEWTCMVRAFDGADVGDWGQASTLVLPLVGDFVITEFMADPQAVSDAAGEWLEIYNASGFPMSLLGFELHDDTGDSHVISEDVPVPPGAYVVLSRNGDWSSNGNVIAAYEYSGFTLSDTVDQIVLSFDGTEIDRFDYDLSTWTDTSGRAVLLDPALGVPDPTLNDDPGSWCVAGDPIAGPGTDFGTPGGANGSCACFLSDADGDGWGDDPSCSWPDCNDAVPDWNPAAYDVCENGIDEDCDGFDAICVCIDTDSDGDGWGDGLACVPPDCDDANTAINPGEVEMCNLVDENCDNVVDNGDWWVMCPPTSAVSVTYCGGGDCAISSCVAGYYDVDGFYSNGCECADDGIGGTCGVATDYGVIGVGGGTSVVGRLPSNAVEDWVRLAFPPVSSRPGGGTPTIQFSARPDSSYLFDVYFDCSGGVAGCGNTGGGAYGVDHYSFVDNQSYGTNAWNWNPWSWPSVVYIRIYRTSSGLTCQNYQIDVSR